MADRIVVMLRSKLGSKAGEFVVLPDSDAHRLIAANAARDVDADEAAEFQALQAAGWGPPDYAQLLANFQADAEAS